MAAPRNPALELINEEFPVDLQQLVAPALRRAYSAAKRAIEIVEFLDTPSGHLQKGDLILKSAEFEFSKLIKAGTLPGFDAAWEDYTLPTGKHLVMRTRRARFTINQVPSISSKPRYATFRANFGASNTAYLFPEMNEEAKREDERRHLVLLHGYHDLVHAAIGMPHPTRNRLIARTDNLLELPANDFGTAPPPEGPTEPPDLEAIEDLVRVVRDTK